MTNHGLLPAHAAMLESSAITPDVIAARGYKSITVRAELGRLGFAESQRNVSALLLPLHNVHGEIGGYQTRPDCPRVVDGRVVKYETPRGFRMQLDVPPAARRWLADPSRPLIVTEGVKKGDAAASRGLCCVALIGVWNWRGTNDSGGKTALADWEVIALEGRDVYIVFDSDVMLKRAVYLALVRVREFLKSRHARVHVIYLPCGAGGAKVGLDDAFAAGRTVDDLLHLATDELREPAAAAPLKGVLAEAGPYRERDDGIYQVMEREGNEHEVRLTNFGARIAEEIDHNDGSGERRLDLRIELRLGETTSSAVVSSAQYAVMAWPLASFGPRAIVEPGVGTKEHTRAAIQKLSGEIPRRTVYGCTGWMRVNGQWVYLHAGGAIGPVGPVAGINVALPETLRPMALPEPTAGDQIQTAIRTSLGLLSLLGDEPAGDAVLVPVLGIVYRAPLGRCDLSGHLSGESGGGKSEIAALAAQHFAPGFNRLALPSWSSTANSLEVLAFHAKDALLPVDDFVPQGTPQEQAQLYQQADRLFRAVGNGAGRLRLRPDGTPRSPKGPRGIVLSTGEEVPRGRSCQARIVLLDVPKQPNIDSQRRPGTMCWDRLAVAQQQAAAGVLAMAMAGYLRWLARRHDEVFGVMDVDFVALRAKAVDLGSHARDPEKVAQLAVGWNRFLEYAVAEHAIDEIIAADYRERVWTALIAMAEAQGAHRRSSDPVSRLFELLAAAIGAGQAHVAGPDGCAPDQAERWGWARHTAGGNGGDRGQLLSGGPTVGWVVGKDLYLLPDMVLKVANAAAAPGDGIALSPETMGKRLKERGLLVTMDVSRQRNVARPTLAGARRTVWHVCAERVLPADDRPNRPNGPDQDVAGGSRPVAAPRPAGLGNALAGGWAGGESDESPATAECPGEGAADPAIEHLKLALREAVYRGVQDSALRVLSLPLEECIGLAATLELIHLYRREAEAARDAS